jgi:hypothetical protein
MSKVRKPVLRRCTGCLEMLDKRSLVRIVLKQDGGIMLDSTGKSPGRGAYVCKNGECLLKAEKSRGLERSLKCAVPKEVYTRLKDQIQEARG